MRVRLLSISLIALVLVSQAPSAQAQRGLSGQRFESMPFPQPNLLPAGFGANTPRGQAATMGQRPRILLTGYWPPTNNMIRHFSPNPEQNANGWVGENWEGRGYDVYAFFPEFPQGLGQGEGDLEVDYQDTSEDFWRIANSIQPIAIITFSRGGLGQRWELEWKNRNLVDWVDDYTAPFDPTPTPPDASVPGGTIRNPTLPLQDILDAVDAASIPGVNAMVDFAGNGGGFLSEFIGYHGVWYQAEHDDPAQPDWCVGAGHIHVGLNTGLNKARRATEQTLRSMIRYVDQVTDASTGDLTWICPTTAHSSGGGSLLTARGSQSISNNDLELVIVKDLPDNFGLAFYGASIQAPIPFGDGVRCVSAPLYRVPPPVQSDTDGQAVITVDFTQGALASGPGQVGPGDTWHFQYWLRDQAAGGAGFNASSGLSLTLEP